MLFHILFGLFSLGQLGRVSLQGQLINVYLYEPVLLVSVLWLMTKYRSTPLINAFRKFRSLFLFSAVLTLSFLLSVFSYSFSKNLVAGLYLFRLLTYFSFFIYLSHHLHKTKDLKKALCKSLLLFFTATAIASFIQYFLYPNLRNLSYLGWDPHQYRAFGLFFDTGVAAAIYGLGILTIFFRAKALNLSRNSVSIFLASFSILSLLTFSRSFYLAISTTVIYYLMTVRKYIYILTFIVLAIISVWFLPKPFGEGVNLGRTFSIVSRLNDYKAALQIASKSPILGVGYNRIREFKIQETSEVASHSGASFHSSFLIILVTGGLIGLALYLFMLVDFAKISKVSGYYVIFLSIFSLFDNILLHPFILLLLLTLLSMETSAEKN